MAILLLSRCNSLLCDQELKLNDGKVEYIALEFIRLRQPITYK